MWRYRCGNVDSRSMLLDIKVMFSDCGLVQAPMFSTRTDAYWMAGYSPVPQSMFCDFNSGRQSFLVESFEK